MPAQYYNATASTPFDNRYWLKEDKKSPAEGLKMWNKDVVRYFNIGKVKKARNFNNNFFLRGIRFMPITMIL